ncbi:helix-turn-helix domain-containing protein [Flavobacterium sp. '19STA2R22 D10 B1']|uniref:helix-turn-helix domain-containing protein n=1 Tax=Flavobacterium aerium TaxID=3037261 RepID=UPI00278BD734|nr:AraC family transcriptional regulator [Flavobacterium sp. '19STA2R22 D10 B1']
MKNDRQQTVPNVLKSLAELLGTEVINGRVEIPEKYGNGYCAGFVFNGHIRILILNYELHEEIVLENPDVNNLGKMILFKFQHIFPKTEIESTENQLKLIPSVLIGTSRMNTDVIIPIDTKTEAINIDVDANYLNELLYTSEKSPILQSLLENTQPLLFEQMVFPSLQKIVDEMITESVDETFEVFFMRIKAEELICRLLMELVKRDEKHIYALNGNDVQIIYKVRERILTHLDVPPILQELAVSSNMSPTKLKRLFKQIFGNSIFNYYQEFRMKEAARFLKEEKLSVSEVGYRLGFTNLSHFSRMFEQHMGMKPKKYSVQ